MNWKLIDRIVAGAVFAYAFVLYVLTVAPTASFWDSGEFIAIAHGLQVSHPPGAPFYMLVGRLFSIVLAPVFGLFKETGHIALAVNMVSVLASAFTVLLAHLIIVRLVREWQGPPSGWTTAERVTALAGGVIGACTFAVTDSFWFNAVEAEVYALSMLFTAVVVWLVMKWSEQAREEEAMRAGGVHPFGLTANRYLLVIAYLFGLAIGVHLLNLLAVFFIALIVFFTEFERPGWSKKQVWMGILVTGAVSSVVFLAIYPGIVQVLPDVIGTSSAPVFFLFLFAAALVFAVWYTQRKQMQVANLVALAAAVVLIGYSSYALIFIRSAADPPIDENDPETVEAIVSYLKREQYGSTPLLKGASYDNAQGRVGQTEKLFPRRYSPDPSHLRVYDRYSSDWEFFWQYQVGHMYLRYFLWNFVGRASDIQDAPPLTGFGFDEANDYVYQTPSERASRNAYFALPLLLGLIGAAYHFSRDWRRAFAVLMLFLVTGLGIILYLNQTPLQPRERDYSYVASFFAFSLWVGLGATGLLQLALDAFREKWPVKRLNMALAGLGALLFVAVPGWMTVENYDDHDRSGQYIAPDYAYNMLMSLEEDALIFTNGDNDTFPLWYLQEVEGVRRDVRVVNLSLLNTPWYIKQLKNQASRDSEPLPISLSDAQIDNIQPVQWEPREVSLPVDNPSAFETPEITLSGEGEEIQSPMVWRLEGRPLGPNFHALYVADQAVLDILRTNAAQGWKRPLYFAVTVSPDGQLNLQNYFQLEGQAFRIVPIEHNEVLGRVVPEVTPRNLKRFRFTNLANPDVYYDENIRRMVDNYRNVYAHAAERLADQDLKAEARSLLDTLMTEVPFSTIPGDERSFLFIARAYQAAGNDEKVAEVMKLAEPLVLHRLSTARTNRDLEFAAQYVQMVRFAYLDAGDFEAAAAFSDRLADVLDDPTYRQSADELRNLYKDTTSVVTPPGPTDGE